ncbi:hypothetical protein ASD24_23065 [Paenibacillus sp. Root52]|uniref:hypothetical protein n=1 Tax=Paenibacillus sp. Root52 TaxID=1736552 RepID=UPI0006FF0BC8|nr:hypothetical protein [Paenibacillus sp. Root52]KQY91619.1 hypothetical protein ASD24_23065 [Paenibacillus sp. Root52]
MQRSDWFYLWVIISGYLTGYVMYMMTLFLLYREADVVTDSFIGWTAVMYLTSVMLLYLLSVLFLRLVGLYRFWSQTIMFVLTSFLTVYMTAWLFLGTGLSSLPPISFPFTAEGLPFLVFWTSTALTCSWGVWVVRNPSTKPLFLLLSRVTFILFIIWIGVR